MEAERGCPWKKKIVAFSRDKFLCRYLLIKTLVFSRYRVIYSIILMWHYEGSVTIAPIDHLSWLLDHTDIPLPDWLAPWLSPGSWGIKSYIAFKNSTCSLENLVSGFNRRLCCFREAVIKDSQDKNKLWGNTL